MSTTETPESVADAPQKTLLLIHGSGPKPAREVIEALWLEALQQGLSRDYPDLSLEISSVRFIYFADLLATIGVDNQAYDPVIDAADRENTLAKLLTRDSARKFRRVHYESLPGKSSWKEFLLDVGAPVSNLLGLGERRIAHVLPELVAYWNNENNYGSEIRQRIRQELTGPLERGDDIMMLAHCVGSVFAYDLFSEMSHLSVENSPNKLHTLVTLGSPLADNYVRSKLGNSVAANSTMDYPNMLINWFNVAAEDDFICHDETIANDFSDMLKNHVISQIEDYKIYNLAVRFGRSNPHSALGYLVHPRIIKLLATWLN